MVVKIGKEIGWLRHKRVMFQKPHRFFACEIGLRKWTCNCEGERFNCVTSRCDCEGERFNCVTRRCDCGSERCSCVIARSNWELCEEWW